MALRITGPWVRFVWILAFTSGCGGSAAIQSSAKAALAPGSAPEAEVASARASEGDALPSPAAAPPPAAAPVAPPGPSPSPDAGQQSAVGATVASAPSEAQSVAKARREMLDIEAHVALQVSNVERTLKALHALSVRVGGVVTSEQVDTASEYGSASLTLRVPSAATTTVFELLPQLGKLLSQSVTARDVGKEYYDAELRLTSLETTLRRYEQILARADKVEEILRIEQELARLRSEIEQVKGNLRWLVDRVARATLHISLREQAPEVVARPEPQAKFYPGLRAPLLLDFGQRRDIAYGGGGLSLRFGRGFSFDLDFTERLGSNTEDSEAKSSNTRGPDVLIATLGGELYSDLLGSGRRRYLNPYLGLRAGYARFDRNDQVLVGATLGVELFKTHGVMLDLETRHALAFGGDRGLHYLLIPALAGSIAF